MGPKDKRFIADFAENYFEDFTQQIAQLAGHEIEFDVDWETLLTHADTDKLESYWTRGCFDPILDAFREMSSDESGLDILEAVKCICIRGDYTHSLKAFFDEETLTVDFAFYNETALGDTDGEAYDGRVEMIQECIETNLA